MRQNKKRESSGINNIYIIIVCRHRHHQMVRLSRVDAILNGCANTATLNWGQECVVGGQVQWYEVRFSVYREMVDGRWDGMARKCGGSALTIWLRPYIIVTVSSQWEKLLEVDRSYTFYIFISGMTVYEIRSIERKHQWSKASVRRLESH